MGNSKTHLDNFYEMRLKRGSGKKQDGLSYDLFLFHEFFSINRHFYNTGFHMWSF